MYPLAMDNSRDSGLMPMPTRFVWPYGGRAVFIIGSFTGWRQSLMTPVEGCPTVFQIVCRLPPGYHQYKFVVDGEWRHDEHQPFISTSSNIGIVNTILLTSRESDSAPLMLSSQVPSPGPASSMDVDNEAFQLVHMSAGGYPNTIQELSDIETSQRHISVFMSTHVAYELLPESGKVIAFDVELPVKQAFHVLHEQGISVAPLWDFSKGIFVGVLSAQDFILILRELSRNGSNLTEKELETHTISAWKEAKFYLNRQTNQQANAFSRHLVHAGPDDNLSKVALKILQNGFSTVPIIHSSSADTSNPYLLHLASLSGILKCICRFFKHSPSSLPVLQLPICSLPLGTWVPKIGVQNGRPLNMLRPNASLSEALDLLVRAQVSSIPIVDDNNSLLDVYSRSDITTLAKDRIYAHINLEETSIHQALQYRDYPYGSNILRCHMCLRSDPLHKIIERLSQPGVRRVVVVEAGSKRVEGIVSLRDVFGFLMKSKDMLG